MPHATAEDRLEYQRKYHRENREKLNQRQREYRVRNAESFGQWLRDYKTRPGVAERSREREKRYWRENWSVYKCSSLKTKAKRLGMDFNIEPSDIPLPTHCPIFGIPLVVSDGVLSANSPSVDRIDNTKGYVKGNVVVVSQKANSMKRAATVKEMRQLADYYESLGEFNE